MWNARPVPGCRTVTRPAPLLAKQSKESFVQTRYSVKATSFQTLPSLLAARRSGSARKPAAGSGANGKLLKSISPVSSHVRRKQRRNGARHQLMTPASSTGLGPHTALRCGGISSETGMGQRAGSRFRRIPVPSSFLTKWGKADDSRPTSAHFASSDHTSFRPMTS